MSEKNYHGAWDTWKCGDCYDVNTKKYPHGKGFIPRPCPPTAQPIEVVNFTDNPSLEELYKMIEYTTIVREEGKEFYHPDWPTIKFTFPAINTTSHHNQDEWGSHPDHANAVASLGRLNAPRT